MVFNYYFKYHIVALLAIFLSFPVLFNFSVGQSPYALKFDQDSGLPSMIVYDLFQDKKGFIWLASNDGLTRYDGFAYSKYKSNDQTSIPGSCIKEDRYGRIWFENFDGFLYYYYNNELHSIKQNTPAGFVSYGLTKKNLFVLQKQGIDIYDLKTLKRIKTIPIQIDEPESSVTVNESFYVVVDDIIYKVNESLNLTKSTYFKDKKLRFKLIYNYGDQLYIVSKFNEERKIYFFDLNLNFSFDSPLLNPDIIQASNVVDNQIWLHSSKGTLVYNLKGNKIYLSDHYFGESSISVVIKDFQKNYWFGTIDNGIYFVSQLKDKIYPVNGHAIRIVEGDNGYLLGMKSGELLFTDKKFNIRDELKLNADNLPIYYLHSDISSKLLFVSSKGFYAINRLTNSQMQYNIAMKEIVRLDEKYFAFAASGFCGLYKDPTYKGYKSSVWDKIYEQNKDDEFENIARLKKAIRAKSIDYSLSNNQILVATNIGLFGIDPNHQYEIKNNGSSFYAERVICHNGTTFVLDTKGNLYKIGKDKQFKMFIQNEVFGGTEVNMVKKIGDELLILSKQYIFVYNLLTGKLTSTHVNLGNKTISDVYKKDSELIILTSDGILSLALHVDRKKTTPRFIINKFMVNNKISSYNEPLELGHDENSVSINYSLLEYDGKATPVYYKLNSDEWIRLSNETRTIQFPSLSPGNYLIRFRIGNEIQMEKISFSITSPYWQKWWFYVICFALVAGYGYVYFKLRINRMRDTINLLNEKMELEKNLSKSIQTAVKSQMNPHFFYNALNTIQAYIFTNDKHKANSYLAKFSKLTRTILEMSERETISLSEEIEALTLYLDLEKMRFQESFEYTLECDSAIEKDMIEFPPMIIQPYVENAIKHGLLHREGHKKVSVKFELYDSILTVIIDDNGIGRKRSEELNKIRSEKHKSFATFANEKRLEMLNKGLRKKVGVDIVDKYNDIGVALGTKVIISIPVNNY